MKTIVRIISLIDGKQVWRRIEGNGNSYQFEITEYRRGFPTLVWFK